MKSAIMLAFHRPALHRAIGSVVQIVCGYLYSNTTMTVHMNGEVGGRLASDGKCFVSECVMSPA